MQPRFVSEKASHSRRHGKRDGTKLQPKQTYEAKVDNWSSERDVEASVRVFSINICM